MKNIIEKAYHLDIQLFLRWYNVSVNWNSPLRYLLYIGDGLFWSLLGVVVFYAGIISENPLTIKAGAAFMLTVVLSGFTFILPKSRVNRKRPYASKRVKEVHGSGVECRDTVFGKKENESFPSGHAFWTSAGMFLLTVFWGLPAFIVSAPLAFSMIFFRPNLGVHYPSDTIVGFFMGAMTAGVAVLATFLVPDSGLVLIDFFAGPFAAAGWILPGLLLVSVFKTWKDHV